MRKIVIPTRMGTGAERAEAPRPATASEPRPRLGLRYGAGSEQRDRP